MNLFSLDVSQTLRHQSASEELDVVDDGEHSPTSKGPPSEASSQEWDKVAPVSEGTVS